MLIMEQGDACKCVLKELFQIIKKEFVGIILKTVLMDGEMIIIIVVQIYVQDQTLGIPMVIMKHICALLDAVKALMLIIILEPESVLLSVLEVIMTLELLILALMIVLETITPNDVFSVALHQIHGQIGKLIGAKVDVQGT